MKGKEGEKNKERKGKRKEGVQERENREVNKVIRGHHSSQARAMEELQVRKLQGCQIDWGQHSSTTMTTGHQN